MQREELTAKETKFVHHYLETGDTKEAYKRAGYVIGGDRWWYTKSKKLLEKPRIKKAIEGFMEERKDQTLVDIQTVIDSFMAVYNKAMEKSDFTNACRSMEQLAKYLGMYTGKGENVVMPKDRAELKKDILKYATAVGAKVDFGDKANEG